MQKFCHGGELGVFKKKGCSCEAASEGVQEDDVVS